MATQESLWHIYQIQRLDAQIAAVDRARAGLDDGSALQRAVAERHEAVLARRAEAQKATQAVRDAELALASIEAKLRKVVDTLYGGKVTNPKELQAYEADKESLTRRKDASEDEVLTRMDERDAAQERLAAAEREEAEARQRWEAHVAAYRSRVAELAAQKQALEEQRDALRAQADPALLRRYDAASRLRKALVGLVEEDACGACGMVLPGRVVKQYKSNPDAEIACPTCGAQLLWRTPET